MNCRIVQFLTSAFFRNHSLCALFQFVFLVLCLCEGTGSAFYAGGDVRDPYLLLNLDYLIFFSFYVMALCFTDADFPFSVLMGLSIFVSTCSRFFLSQKKSSL